MHTTQSELRAVRRVADPMAEAHTVPDELRDVDARLIAWARWVGGRAAAPDTSPMFRLMQQNFARARYGAPTVAPAVDSGQALAVERGLRNLPERARELLRGWYYYNAHPRRMCRLLAIRPADFVGELNAARRMLANVLRRH